MIKNKKIVNKKNKWIDKISVRKLNRIKRLAANINSSSDQTRLDIDKYLSELSGQTIFKTIENNKIRAEKYLNKLSKQEIVNLINNISEADMRRRAVFFATALNILYEED